MVKVTGGVVLIEVGEGGGIRRYRDEDGECCEEQQVREKSQVVDVAAVSVPLEAHQGEAQRVTQKVTPVLSRYQNVAPKTVTKSVSSFGFLGETFSR